MNKRIGIIVAAVFFLCVSDSTSQQEFTKPKKGGPSASQLKEQCFQEMTYHLYSIADIITNLGKTQRHLLEHGQDLLENNKSSRIVCKNVQELHECFHKLEKFSQECESFKCALADYERFLSEK